MDLLERLQDPRPILLDAAMGTALIERGLQLEKEDAISWSTAHREQILAVHRSHVAAGAELLLADTFGARAATFIELTSAVAIAKEAGARWTAIPIWPGLGGKIFAQLLRNADRAGADAIWLETGMQLADVARSLRIARDETGLPVAVTLALAAFPSQLQTSEAKQAQELIELLGGLAQKGAAMVGLNCGPWDLEREQRSIKTLASHGCAALVPDHRALARPLELPLMIRALADRLPVPLILKPDAGTGTPVSWARLMGRCVESGARLVGGCCGTGPTHLRALAREIGRAGV
jgi:methionine synthase I (cobalamin-dependent)